MIPDRLTAALADRYRIERELGQGGMATVFLADDLRHHRKVALKVMRPELAAVVGAERFLAEITTTANLQHPHILALFDSGTVDGTVFYVMPFVDGESLRDRLEREKQLPIDDAVRVATEVADALHYAHERGVIHRDIKPENILLHGGHALVADFGIALAASRTSGTRMTETGMSLGTPTYMSPEQAMGERAVDARTDIYALGCVLYEMLVGDPPHTGSTAQAIVAKVITEKPPSITAQRARVPANVEDAVLTALEKLPADRFASAKEFALALSGRAIMPARTKRRAATSASARRLSMRALVVAAVAIAGAAGGWLARGRPTESAAAAPIHFATSFGPPGLDQPFIATSPDGRSILRVITDSTGIPRVFVRDLGSNAVHVLPGTEYANGPEYSPDGQWIAFTANGKLRKIPARGGPATTLLDSMSLDGGAAWTAAGDIIFSGRNSGLWRIPAAGGGTPVQLTRLDSVRKDFGHWSPRLLPGDRAIIYSAYAARSRIEAYDFETGRTKVLVENAVFGRYSPTGHLLYARDAAVFAIAFDPDRLEVSGEAVPVQEGVVWEPNNALAGYDVAPNGTLAFLSDSEWTTQHTLVWRDRTGRDTPAIESPGTFAGPRLSPDGRWIVLAVTRPKIELMLYDVGRRVLTQLSRAPAAAFNPVWLPDSRHVVYTYEDPVYDLHLLTIDASAPDRSLLANAFDKYASAISPDGRHVLLSEVMSYDRLLLAPLDGSSVPQVLSGPDIDHRFGDISPDGRWITYAEYGESSADVYIRSVSGSGGRRLVSAGGGTEPHWTRGGREIVYRSPTAMMSAVVDPATGEVGAPTPLFSTTDLERDRDNRWNSYDVTADGSRFLVVKRIEKPAPQLLHVILNWHPELTPAAGRTK